MNSENRMDDVPVSRPPTFIQSLKATTRNTKRIWGSRSWEELKDNLVVRDADGNVASGEGTHSPKIEHMSAWPLTLLDMRRGLTLFNSLDQSRHPSASA